MSGLAMDGTVQVLLFTIVRIAYGRNVCTTVSTLVVYTLSMFSVWDVNCLPSYTLRFELTYIPEITGDDSFVNACIMSNAL